MSQYFDKIVKRQLFSIIALFTITLSFSSCLKEGDAFPQSDDDAKEIIELGSAQTPDSYITNYQAFSVSGEFVNDTSGFYAIVQYSGASETAPQDITVTLGTDTAALNAYNEENSTSYVAFDSTMLSYSKTVTIAKGTDRTRIRVVVNDTTGFDFASTQALPLKITSTSYGVISANTSTKIYAFTAKNAYDGVYSVVSGTVTRYTSPGVPANDALSGSMVGNANMTARSTDSYTVELGNLKWAGGASNVAGIDNLRATVDPTTNEVTMTSLGNATLTNISGAVNKYDPETKTFTLNFIWNPTGSVRTIQNLVLKYYGSR